MTGVDISGETCGLTAEPSDLWIRVEKATPSVHTPEALFSLFWNTKPGLIPVVPASSTTTDLINSHGLQNRVGDNSVRAGREPGY